MMTFTMIPTMQLPSGEAVPILGQGTWGMGEDPRRSKAEAAALRFGFDALVRAGKIRYWGVSNFDLGDLEALVSWPMGATIATNQVLYNPLRRGIEWDLLP